MTLTLLLATPSGCTAAKQWVANIGVAGGEETLVSGGVTNVRPFWRGRGTALVCSTEEDGVFWHDIRTGERILVVEQVAVPLQRSPDGRRPI